MCIDLRSDTQCLGHAHRMSTIVDITYRGKEKLLRLVHEGPELTTIQGSIKKKGHTLLYTSLCSTFQQQSISYKSL